MDEQINLKRVKRHDFCKYFKRGLRVNKTSFDYLTDDAPESLKGLMQSMPDGCWPGDWTYRQASKAFEALESDELDNITIEGDCCTIGLIEWLKEAGAIDKCDDVIRDVGSVGDLLHIVRCAQETEIQRIYGLVNEFLETELVVYI